MATPSYDVIIIGGGIVGLATAMELLAQRPGMTLAVLEKESTLAAHQTGHNSGVIHSGIYYRPGSLKAKFCVTGAKLMVEFCEAHHISYRICGKLVIATDPSEIPMLEQLYQRGIANGVPGVVMVGPEQIRELEPHARGIKALHVPSAGIVDYAGVARAYAEVIRARGGQIITGARVDRLTEHQGAWVVHSTRGEMGAKYLIACGGLHADQLATMTGVKPDVRIVPFRGEYYEVVPERQALVNHMIYPVPNPGLPFLGVHFTRTIAGGLHAGPNAVLALKREGYRWSDISIPDLVGLVGFAGFWRMARQHWRVGIEECYRSLNKGAFVRALQRLVPEIRSGDLVPAPAGVRAQAVNASGSLLDDFDIIQSRGAMHVRHVPSPAATASLCIGRAVAEQALSASS